MSAGEDDHPMDWCFMHAPREGMAGMARHLILAWGQPMTWSVDKHPILNRVFKWIPTPMACEFHKGLYERRNKS